MEPHIAEYWDPNLPSVEIARRYEEALAIYLRLVETGKSEMGKSDMPFTITFLTKAHNHNVMSERVGTSIIKEAREALQSPELEIVTAGANSKYYTELTVNEALTIPAFDKTLNLTVRVSDFYLDRYRKWHLTPGVKSEIPAFRPGSPDRAEFVVDRERLLRDWTAAGCPEEWGIPPPPIPHDGKLLKASDAPLLRAINHVVGEKPKKGLVSKMKGWKDAILNTIALLLFTALGCFINRVLDATRAADHTLPY